MKTATKMLSVTVNGSQIEISGGAKILDLLSDLDLKTAMVAVELNAQIVPKGEFAQRLLAEGDVIEIVHFVGGG